MKSLHFRMAYLNTCTMLLIQQGKESSPYWSIKMPHLGPAPHGSVICRKAQKHIVIPMSHAESQFSHQNITSPSFQLIKGQLDILYCTVSVCVVKMEHERSQNYRHCTRTLRFKNEALKNREIMIFTMFKPCACIYGF